MKQWRAIRQAVLVDGMSKRQACREFGIHWETLRKILAHPAPPGYRRVARVDHPVMGPWMRRLAALLEQRRGQPRKQALSKHRTLGRYFEKYRLAVQLALPITEFVVAHIQPCRRGVLLGLAEVYQARDRVRDALECLKKLRQEAPDDVVVKLSIAELISEAYPGDKRLAKQVVELAGDVENESSVHAALMLYKAQALRTLGLPTAARDVLTPACRKTKDRDEELLRAIRYERAQVYEDLGRKTQARREFEKLYAADPSYGDVVEKLGI